MARNKSITSIVKPTLSTIEECPILANETSVTSEHHTSITSEHRTSITESTTIPDELLEHSKDSEVNGNENIQTVVLTVNSPDSNGTCESDTMNLDET